MFFHGNATTTLLLLLSIILSITSSSIFCLCLSLQQQDDEITTIRIGSRPSKLATIQAKAVASHLQSHHPNKNNIKPILVPIQASGDIIIVDDPSSSTLSTSLKPPPAVIQDVPLAFSTNVDFTRTLDDAIIEGKIDIAVHSLKDIPPDHRWNSQLKIYCPLPREDSHDVLIGPYKTIQELPHGTKVGTSSIRRQAQLLYQCCSKHNQNNRVVEVVNLRGNVETRLSALRNGDVDALILARSGLHRLQMLLSSLDDDNNNNERNIHCNTIPYNDMLPGTCQGIVAAVVLKGGKFDNNDNNNDENENDNDEGIFWNNNNCCIINEESTLMAYAERQFLNILDLATPWKGRPPLAGILEKYHHSKEEEEIDTTTTYWKFRGLLASTDGKHVISSEKTSMELQQQKEEGGEVSNLTKEMAISLGEQVARDILEQAGPHFFDDDDGPR